LEVITANISENNTELKPQKIKNKKQDFLEFSPHTNFWLLFTFKELNILFLGTFFVIGRFGVPVIFLGFWVEPANSVG
jgi:hypothetical protein